jgi:molecular chaperone DnaJ
VSDPIKDSEKIFEQFGDIFGQFFGAATKSSPRGADLKVDLPLTYLEARDGAKRDLAITRKLVCKPCNGTGAETGVRVPCPSCAGKGFAAHTTGPLSVQTACTRCKGQKQIADVACTNCTDGLVATKQTVTITIPAGVKPENVLRLQGKGDEHASGPTGTLYIALQIDVENVLRRDGEHAVIEVPVPLRVALFGGSLPVQTPDGAATVKVRRRAYDGEIITLTGQGFARAGGDDPYRGTSRGDQKVVLRISHQVRKQRDTVRWTVATILIIALMIAFSRVTR